MSATHVARSSFFSKQLFRRWTGRKPCLESVRCLCSRARVCLGHENVGLDLVHEGSALSPLPLAWQASSLNHLTLAFVQHGVLGGGVQRGLCT